jgi:acyl carrier protein
MTTTTTTRRDTVRDTLLAGLTECSSVEEVAEALEAVPDDYLFELDSKTAEFVMVFVEDALGLNLPTPADLGREQFATLGALIDAILDRRPEDS